MKPRKNSPTTNPSKQPRNASRIAHSLSELAGMIGVASSTLSTRQHDPKWKASCVDPKGNFLVEPAIKFEQEKRKADLAKQTKNSPEEKALKIKRLEQQLEDGAIRLKMLSREDDLNRISYESKRGLWFTRKEVEELTGYFVQGLEDVARAIELEAGAEAGKIVKDILDKSRLAIQEQIKKGEV